MIAIVTKFLGPTNTKPARVKATAGGNSVTVSYHSDDFPHKLAALNLCKKMGWTGKLVGGHTSTGMVYVFVGEIVEIEE